MREGRVDRGDGRFGLSEDFGFGSFDLESVGGGVGVEEVTREARRVGIANVANNVARPINYTTSAQSKIQRKREHTSKSLLKTPPTGKLIPIGTFCPTNPSVNCTNIQATSGTASACGGFGIVRVFVVTSTICLRWQIG